MAKRPTVADRILKVLPRSSGCQLEELELRLPDLTWNQLVLGIDQLSRTRRVRVTALGGDHYNTVRLPIKGKRATSPDPSPVRREGKRGSGRGAAGLLRRRGGA